MHTGKYGCYSKYNYKYIFKQGEGVVREFGIDMYTLLYLGWMTSKDLQIWNSAQFYVAAWMGWSLRENGYMYMYVYGWVPLLST